MKNTFILIVVSVLFLAGCSPTSSELPVVDDSIPLPPPELPIEEPVKSMPPEAAPKDLPSAQEVSNTASYEDYSTSRLTELKGAKPFALFFHATWCPSCRALEADILKNIDSIGNAVILKADYDTETALKKEYGVTTQDTVVLINADGSVSDKKIFPKLNYIKNFFK